jgi:hypothetical protein
MPFHLSDSGDDVVHIAAGPEENILRNENGVLDGLVGDWRG